MLRDKIDKKVEPDLILKWQIKTHVDETEGSLEITPTGDVVERNTADPNNYVLCSTSTEPCNCNMCQVWRENTENIQSLYDTKKDFIETCIMNRDRGASFLGSIYLKIAKIPPKFFNDEK